MPQIEIPDALHELITQTAEALDMTPGHILSRMLFGAAKKMPIHPTKAEIIRQQLQKQGTQPTTST